MDTRPRFLMTDPSAFDVSYRINPWMNPAAWTPEQGAAAKAGSRALREALVGLGAHVETIEAVRGLPDLVFPARRKVIQVHGCFWHVHDCRYGRVKPATNAGFWANKRTENAARDRRNLAALEAAGWSVLVVWECETRTPEPLIRKLREFLDGSTARAQAASR